MKKKSIAILMFIIVSLTFSETLYLNETFADTHSISEDDSLQKMDDEEADRLILQGDNLRRMRSSKYLNVSLYTQTDARWADETLGNSTMRSAGCAVTSFAMVMRYYKGASHTPFTVLQTMGIYAADFNWIKAGEFYDVTCEVVNGKTADEYISAIIGLINVSRPVIIGMNSPGDPHFVIAYGYSGNTIYIKDPGNKYTTLQAYLNDGYYVYEIINCYEN